VNISILFSRYDTNASASDSDEGSGDSGKEKKKKKEKEIKPKKTKTVVSTQITVGMSYWDLVICWFKVQ
jgi:hypothetical protein